METKPASTYTKDDVTDWLEGIAAGSLDLTVDDRALAAAALAILAPPAPTPPPDTGDYLSPHFTLGELTYSDTANAMGIDNTPDADEVEQLAATADLLEKIREACGGNPVMVSSGYRCPQLNAAVGGATNSAHVWGGAADFTIPAFGSPLDVCHAIEPHLGAWEVDQLIYEISWVHIGRAPEGYAPRCQCLTIDANGTREGIA